MRSVYPGVSRGAAREIITCPESGGERDPSGIGLTARPGIPSPAAEPRLYPKLAGDHGFGTELAGIAA